MCKDFWRLQVHDVIFFLGSLDKKKLLGHVRTLYYVVTFWGFDEYDYIQFYSEWLQKQNPAEHLSKLVSQHESSIKGWR